MKITVELDEFWMDGEDDLSSALSSHVQQQVVRTIWKKLEERVENQIQLQVSKMVEKQLFRKGQSMVNKVLKSSKIKSPSSSIGVDGRCSLEELIVFKLTQDSGWSSPSDQIKKLAQQLGQDMKNRYDLMFASQLVVKLNEQGLLKEDVAKLLIESK